MDRKPTSIVDFLKAVLFVKNPGLLDVDKLILLAMAIFADAHTGGNSYLGVDNLCEITGRGRRAIQYRLRQLETAKLIECTNDSKGGRGHAAVYRICLENPAYREFISKKERNAVCALCGKKECKRDCALSQLIPPETAQPAPVKGAMEPVKGATDAVESASRIAPHPEAIRTPPSPLPNPCQPNAGWEGWLTSKTAAIGPLTKKDRHDLEKLISEHGLAVVQEIVRQFENRDKGFVGVKLPWILFFNEAPGLIPAAKEAVRKASPEYKARQNLFEIQISVLLNEFCPLPPADWPPLNEQERALLKKAKAGNPHELFLSLEELNYLRGLSTAYSDWQNEKRKGEASPALSEFD